jgi:hypothetical protein
MVTGRALPLISPILFKHYAINPLFFSFIDKVPLGAKGTMSLRQLGYNSTHFNLGSGSMRLVRLAPRSCKEPLVLPLFPWTFNFPQNHRFRVICFTVRRGSSRYIPSYWHQPGTEPLCALTLGQVVDIAADRWGDKEALKSLYQGHRFTFTEVRDEVI